MHSLCSKIISMGAGDRALSNRAVCKGESVGDDIEMHLS